RPAIVEVGAMRLDAAPAPSAQRLLIAAGDTDLARWHTVRQQVLDHGRADVSTHAGHYVHVASPFLLVDVLQAAAGASHARAHPSPATVPAAGGYSQPM